MHSSGFKYVITRCNGNQLPLGIWYPSDKEEKLEFFGPYSMPVALQGKVIKGNGKLVGLSHGSEGHIFGHRLLARYLSKLGYVVVAPLHKADNYLDHSQSGTPELWRRRPIELKFALSYILEEKEEGLACFLDGSLDLIGFSIGGYTVLSLLGARGSIRALLEHHERYPGNHLPCLAKASGLTADKVEKLARESQKAFPDLVDNRIRKAIVMAPDCTLFGDETLKNIKTPLSIYCAEHDDFVKEPYHSLRLKKLVSSIHSFSCVKNAGHFSFLNPLPQSIENDYPELSFDRDAFSRTAFHKRLNKEIAYFLSDEESPL